MAITTYNQSLNTEIRELRNAIENCELITQLKGDEIEFVLKQNQYKKSTKKKKQNLFT
jgi:hypothetical protein